ncbi:MAG: hypothetical protein MZW92_59190 [Comamonadaceae bacterium]|nr:hypothetical protein [Comamonadaceae bacterium]
MEARDLRERVRRQRHERAGCSGSTRCCCSATRYGHVDQAIGKNVAAGSAGLIAPNRLIIEGLRGDHARRRDDGVPERAGHRGAGRR